MAIDRKATHRQRMRDRGLRPLEVWLPASLINSIDELKRDGVSRDAVITNVINSYLNRERHQNDDVAIQRNPE
ncbi:hypothetical protein GCM10011349_32120 [Novosphingobium indicum]|uniref:CopG family transcriptional regulator n=2 Tax=Novosphingobium TaxID=165696 RepID=A0ABQ2JVM7_9SPHN|nr:MULTISPECIES: antitoxin MazE-like protein [Novosphingobium]MCJ2180087.1 antitoxin MazE family protein [Novosphingobium album (ex Hu et al. 2023)]GGN55457.1 hypothetical protein GCM10011349_32120 [Novosphingobium indicum]